MMDDFISRIVTEVQETEEDFIFTTIQPFCEDVIKRKISKAELVKLLSQPKIVRCGECKWLVKSEDVCKLLSNNYEPPVYVELSDFCSRGERRADDET